MHFDRPNLRTFLTFVLFYMQQKSWDYNYFGFPLFCLSCHLQIAFSHFMNFINATALR